LGLSARFHTIDKILVMYPKISNEITNCLQGLVGIRTECTYSALNAPPFFIEDIEGMDIKRMAALARGSSMKGADWGRWIINSAARQMMGDIELLMSGGYNLKNIVGDSCSKCTLVPAYTAGAGVVVRSSVQSNYQMFSINKLEILIDRAGNQEFNLDDGVTVVKKTANFIPNTIIPVLLNYSTDQKAVKIYFTDPTIGVGQVICPTNSSCGCGSTNPNTIFSVGGLVAGVPSAAQYGFIPCAGVTCSYSSLVCKLINQAPNIFGLTLLYKVGDIAFVAKNQSGRNNEDASYNETQDTELQRNFGQLYWAKMKGTGGVKGIKNIINDYLARNARDGCVSCDAKVYTSYAIG
jgi:hypothetical protein